MEPPPPLFEEVPTVEDIRRGDEPNTYVVTLRETGGEARTARFTVDDGGPLGPAVAWADPDIFWRWPGDAESVRSVVRQVVEAHKATVRE
jgi:hypothetical protein